MRSKELLQLDQERMRRKNARLRQAKKRVPFTPRITSITPSIEDESVETVEQLLILSQFIRSTEVPRSLYPSTMFLVEQQMKSY
jgi:hypothetical protein